ncbi:MAG TPA: superoxide dismutase [Propionibacteriaceae bacterium]|nr:superoxide dismutase [Propionibacteriaceae bacterium]
MTFRSHLRLLAAAALAAALSATLVTPAQARPSYPDEITLPVGFRPEGIAIGKAPFAYLGSLADGDIYRVNLRTGKGRVISEGGGATKPSVGLKIDRRGLLYVAGGVSGEGRVINSRTGRLLATYPFASGATFVNDVVLTRRAAWFTDSQQPVLYRVARNHHGKRLANARVTKLPLVGDWVQAPGEFGANGIVETPNHRALLVVRTRTGQLFRVNKGTGVAKPVDLGGVSVLNGDGLLLRGRTLYVVQNQDNKVTVFKLNRRGTEGRLVKTLTDPDFDVPTTVASYRDSLYLPNARFGQVPDPAAADYSINRVDR